MSFFSRARNSNISSIPVLDSTLLHEAAAPASFATARLKMLKGP